MAAKYKDISYVVMRGHALTVGKKYNINGRRGKVLSICYGGTAGDTPLALIEWK